MSWYSFLGTVHQLTMAIARTWVGPMCLYWRNMVLTAQLSLIMNLWYAFNYHTLTTLRVLGSSTNILIHTTHLSRSHARRHPLSHPDPVWSGQLRADLDRCSGILVILTNWAQAKLNRYIYRLYLRKEFPQCHPREPTIHIHKRNTLHKNKV